MNNYETNASNRPFVAVACSRLAVAVFVSSLFAASGMAAGADTFKAKCAGCHGADGGGKTALGTKLKLRDLRAADVQKQSDSELQTLIENGKPPMPAFGKSVGTAGVHELVAYMRTIAAK